MTTPALPPGWATTCVRDVITEPLANGRSIRDGDGPRVLRLSALRGAVLDPRDSKAGDWSKEEAARYVIRSGDLLVSRGNGTLSLVGRGALVPDGEHDVAFPDTMIRIRLNPLAFVSDYAATLWNSPATRGQIEGAARTTAGIYKINQELIEAISLVVPPIAEQERIAAALEPALALRERLAGTLEALERRLAACEEAWLRSAVTSGVSDRGGEPVTDLLDTLGVTPLKSPGGDFPTLPKGWLWCRLGDIADVTGGVTKDVKTQGRDGLVEVPYLRVANVQRGALRLENVSTIRVTPTKLAALRLLTGDVLMNEGGDRDKLGRGWVWEGQIDDCIHQNHVFRARVLGGLLEPKLLSWFGNTWGQRYFERHGKQTTNLASVSLRTLKSLPVPIPPIGVQGDLVATIDETLELVARARSGLGALRERVDVLQRSLFTAAVEGRLVPQDPSDEPAELLLKRIQHQREAAAAEGASARTVRKGGAAAKTSKEMSA